MLKKEEKMKLSEELANKLKSYKTVGFIDMFKMPTKEFKEIKSKISKNVEIKFYKKSIILHALKKAGIDSGLEKIIPDQTALIFSNEDPFELFGEITKIKSETYAKEGDVAEEDIVVKKGPTDLKPGPVISEFAKVKIPAGVEKGVIAIKKDTVVVKKGETISQDVASILRKLKMKPIKIGVSINGFYHSGSVIDKSVLELVLKYPEMLKEAHQKAINLTLNIGYPTKENIKMLLSIAHMKAEALNRLIGGAR